jgi:zinc transporter ZupT
MNRKKVLRVLLFVVVFILIATIIAYYIYKPVNEWLAFYIACCGGVFIVNLVVSMIFIGKNFKDKGRP